MVDIPKELLLLMPVDDPSPVGAMNLMEQGDIWIKTKGCDTCPIEMRRKCCGDCPMLSPDAICILHSFRPYNNKPYKCIAQPRPNSCVSWCSLEYTCVQGSHKGKVRRLRESLDVLTD